MSSVLPVSSLPPTHRALRQDVYARPPTIQHIPTPQATPGSAVLRVEVAGVISYLRDVYNGVRKYPYPVPLTIGTSAIARVVALGPDATSLKPGDLCLLDITIRGRDDIDRSASATFLSAIHEGFSEGSKKLMHGEWRDGCYAEYVKWPLENCFVLNEKKLLGPKEEGGLGYAVEDLMFMSRLMVPYGGLGPSCIDLKPGETVLLSPATGGFGRGAVQLCLEMGAGKVICMGRNQKMLQDLKQAAGPDKGGRVVCLPLTGDFDTDLKAIQSVGEPVDVYFDISPPAAKDSGHLKAGIFAMRNGGRACLMGGIQGDVALPHSRIMHSDLTIKGKWMYEKTDVKRMVQMVESGVVKLNTPFPLGWKVARKYKLEEWEKAFDEAANADREVDVLIEP